jgi:hypothetical protein
MKRRTHDITHFITVTLYCIACLFLLILLYIIVVVIVVFILCMVFIVLCAVFRLILVLFYVVRVICVVWLIVVPLPPGKSSFAVKINNNKNNKKRTCLPIFNFGGRRFLRRIATHQPYYMTPYPRRP